MLLEFSLMGLCLTGAFMLYSPKEEKIRDYDFSDAINNVFYSKNKKECYYANNLKDIENGYTAIIYISNGGSFSELQSLQKILEDNLGADVDLEQIEYTNKVKATFITKANDKKEYEPVKQFSNELFLGAKLAGDYFKINLDKDPHCILAGKTGTGKSFLLALMLVNLDYHCKDFIELYLCQTSKRDIDYLKDLKSVKFSAYTPAETEKCLDRAVKMIEDRAKQFSSIGVKDIVEYNSVNKRKMKRQIYVFEEISLYMPDDTDTEEEKESKNRVWKLMWKIVKLGRSTGIHFIGLTQRTTAANLGGSGEIKSQLCRITLAQSQEIDSRNVIDINDAKYLKDQEAIYYGNQGTIKFNVPTIDKGLTILNKYVPEVKIYNAKKATQAFYDVIEIEGIKTLPLLEKTKDKPIEAKKDDDNKIVDLEVATTKHLKKKRGMIRDVN